MKTKSWRVFVFAWLIGFLLAGCTAPQDGDDEPDDDPGDGGMQDDPDPVPEPVTVSVSTAGNYPVDPGFNPEELSVPAGANVTLEFTNEDLPLVDHGWRVDGIEGASTDTVAGGESAQATFTALEPGEYTYYCPVGDHRERGQEGTLVVTAS